MLRGSQRGFSLIELALGLIIVATMLSALLVPLATQMDQRRTSETTALLEQAREALLGFAVGRGRFPCPAIATSNGQESFSNAADGTCTTQRGFLPAVTLGLSPVDANGFQLDGFGGATNRIRYAVSDAIKSATNKLYTVDAGIRGANIAAQIAASSTGNFSICSVASTQDTTCSHGVTLANQTAIVVVYSLGKGAATRDNSTDEAENVSAVAAKRILVSRGYSDAAGQEFDDILLWISPSVLISRLAAAGQL